MNVLIPGLTFVASDSEVSPGGNIDSRVTDGVILYIYSQCMLCMCLVAFVKSSHSQGQAPASHAPQAPQAWMGS